MEDFACRAICEGRKQFRGFKGSRGIVPKDTKHGDIICILGAAEIPFVLRAVKGKYVLIGDAYIEFGNEFDVSTSAAVQTFHLQ